MGCQTSKAKGENTNNVQGGDSATFLEMANHQKHPVALELLKEWTMFVDAQARKVAGDPTCFEDLERRPNEVWANNENNRVTHRSVDYVGKLFLEYIKKDLSTRGWGGNFDYKVAGVAKQGFIRASANVEVAYGEVSEVVGWGVKVHYHSCGAA